MNGTEGVMSSDEVQVARADGVVTVDEGMLAHREGRAPRFIGR